MICTSIKSVCDSCRSSRIANNPRDLLLKSVDNLPAIEYRRFREASFVFEKQHRPSALPDQIDSQYLKSIRNIDHFKPAEIDILISNLGLMPVAPRYTFTCPFCVINNSCEDRDFGGLHTSGYLWSPWCFVYVTRTKRSKIYWFRTRDTLAVSGADGVGRC